MWCAVGSSAAAAKQGTGWKLALDFLAGTFGKCTSDASQSDGAEEHRPRNMWSQATSQANSTVNDDDDCPDTDSDTSYDEANHETGTSSALRPVSRRRRKQQQPDEADSRRDGVACGTESFMGEEGASQNDMPDPLQGSSNQAYVDLRQHCNDASDHSHIDHQLVLQSYGVHQAGQQSQGRPQQESGSIVRKPRILNKANLWLWTKRLLLIKAIAMLLRP